MESVEISVVDPPVGFRFRPTDEELVNHYLKLKTLGSKAVEWIIPEVDVHQLPPWDLPGKINELSRTKSDGDEWFFFSHLQNKDPQSKRSRRTNDYGSWKATGKTNEIRTQDKKNVLGLKKILVFKERQSPKNAHTKWVLHEYHINGDLMDNVLNDQSDVVLCRLKKKPDKKVKENSKTQKNNTGISIMFQEGSGSSPNTIDEVNSTSISIMPHEGNISCCYTPDEVHNTSCSSRLVTAKSIVSEEIPQMSVEEFMVSLPPLQPLDDILSDYDAPTYQPQAEAEEGSLSPFDFSYDNDGNELDYGHMPSPYSNLANYPSFGWGNV